MGAGELAQITLAEVGGHGDATSCWMVIGQVVAGLDVAERISVAPLERPRDIKPRRYAPRDPVAIEAVKFAPPQCPQREH